MLRQALTAGWQLMAGFSPAWSIGTSSDGQNLSRMFR